MNIIDVVGMSLGTARDKKLRFALNLVGILIGCAAVGGLISITDGMRQDITGQIMSFGPNVINVYPDNSGLKTPVELNWRDLRMVQAIQGVENATPMNFGGTCAYKARGDDQRAIKEMEIEVDRYPDYLPARIELGDLYLRVGDGRAAALHLNQAIQLDSGQARAHFLLGKALFEQADLDNALRSFDHASRLDPSMAQVHYWKAQIYMQQGKREKAQTEIALFEEKKKGQPDF